VKIWTIKEISSGKRLMSCTKRDFDLFRKKSGQQSNIHQLVVNEVAEFRLPLVIEESTTPRRYG
jgi:hypothetical protein